MTDEKTTNTAPPNPYHMVSQEVFDSIMRKGQTYGDPQLYGASLSQLLMGYLGGVANRPLGPADAFVVQILSSCANMVSGGVQAQWFRDIAAAAIAGSVHVEEANRRMAEERAREAAQRKATEAGQDGPGTAAEGSGAPMPPAAGLEPLHVPEGMLLPTRGKPGQQVVGGDGCTIGHFDPSGAFVDDRPAAGLEPAADAPDAPATDMPTKMASRVGTDVGAADRAVQADLEQVPDVDLWRWALDPEGDAWADLLEPPPDPAKPGDRERKEGVTQEQVQARFDRLHAFFDVRSNKPANMLLKGWQAAQYRNLPSLYGDA